ncbi:9222_t:CDS:1 [Scutellospora calospora]|uniref:9222_t:CDS:1 n=1 Tax=Scutellospora calospora TaxID=85575 RepID=A0ACA9K240_9GLOM|nr:9222_t:CDS:1 [Scutellospora calospora]
MPQNNAKPVLFADYFNQQSNSNISANNKKKNDKNYKPDKQKKDSNSDKEQKNELLKSLRKKNIDITKNRESINKLNREIGKSRMDDEKIHLNKRISLLEKQDLKLSKERITIIKNLFKVGETLASLLTRKIINEDIIREIEKISPKSTSDLVKNDKRKSIKDKSNSKVGKKQQELTYLQKQLKTFFNKQS